MSERKDAEETSLLGIGTWTKQGPATLVLRENSWAVLVPGLRKRVIEAAWTVLGEKPAPEEFLDRLVEVGELESADKLTALLFGFHDGTSAVFGVKGKTPIAVYTAEGSQQIAGTEDEPFVLRSLEGVRRMAFGELPAEDGLGAPRIESGIVPVRGFVYVSMDPAELEEDERAALAEQVEKDGRSIEDPETKKRRAERPAPKPVKSTPPPSRPAASTSRSSSAPSRSGAGAGTSSGGAAAAEPPAPNMFDGLFGGGASKPAASAPAPAPETAAPPAAASSPAAAPAAAAPSPAAAPQAEPAAPAAPAGASAAAASSSSGATAGTPGRKRRLVSSSLFDRRTRSTPGAATQTASSPKDGAAPASGSTPSPGDPASAEAPENSGSDSAPEQPQAERAPGEKDPAEQTTPEQKPTEQTPAASAPSAEPVDSPASPADSSADPADPVEAPESPAESSADPVDAPASPPAPAAASGADAAPSAPTADAAPSVLSADAAPAAAADAAPAAAANASSAAAAGDEEPSATPAEATPAEASPAAPVRATAPATPAPAPTPPASIPTPEPPEEDLADTSAEDELEAPVTLIAPIDEEENEDAAPAPAARRAPAARAAAASDAGGDLENTGAYDDLFGKTVFRRIEDAAVRRSEEEDEEDEDEEESTPDASESSSPSSASPADPDPGPEPAGETPRSGAPSEFIDWVPGVGRAAPEIAQAAARRAAAPPAPEPAYPQVHMAERPPDPNTGSRPAPVRPSMPMPPPAPYEQPGTAAPAGPPMNTGAAGQQLGYQARSGPPSPYPQPAVNPGAAGHQVGFRGPQAPAGHGGGNPPFHGWTGSPNPARPPQHGWTGQPYPARPPQQGGPMPQNAAPQQQMPPRGAPSQGMPPQGVPPQAMPPQGMPPRGVAPQQGVARPGTPPPPHRPQQAASAPTGHPSAPSAAGPGQSAGSAVTVPGLVCANGHANAPERQRCLSCGAPLQGEPRTVVRPPLGTVLIAGGERFVLDRTAIIGRRPRASRVSGNDVPQLITVPSPQQDISRSHLELRLEGWHVVALDLGTTNGTTLHREGFEPVRLRPREGVALYDGDLLDLGDGVKLTFGERA